MRTTRLSICLLAAALAGCGSDGAPPSGEEPPTAGELVAGSVEAIARRHDGSARFRLRAEVKPDLGGPAALMLGDRLSLEVEGGASADALQASGKVEAAGESFEGELRVGEGFYVRVGEDWYGTPDGGPANGDLTLDLPAGVAPAQFAAALREAGDDLIDGDVEPGPEIGGDRTWQLKGTVNPGAAVAIGRAIGAPVPPADEAALRQEAGDLRIEYAAGRDDQLPRRIALSGSLGTAELTGDLLSGVPLEGLELDVELELSDWGAPVTVEAPERYTSFQELIGSFFAGSGLEVEVSPGGPSGGPPPELPPPSIPVPPAGVPVPHP